LQHALKKILCAGNRGYKDEREDIQNIIDTMQRKLEMMVEDEYQSNPEPILAFPSTTSK